MPFDNDTNRKRAERMIEVLDLIETSAKSNGAEPQDIINLLQPVLDRLNALCGVIGAAEPSVASGPGQRTRPWPPGALQERYHDLDRVQRCDLITLLAADLSDFFYDRKGGQ